MTQFEDKTLLVTGGTGSFGNAFVDYLLFRMIKAKKVIVFSRDEYKQHIMDDRIKKTYRFSNTPPRKTPKHYRDNPMRFFLGDVRDLPRLTRALSGVDIVIHAAALKHVSTGEYDPQEMVKTNVIGTQNVIDAAIDNNVDKIILLSSDKAVDPLNLYGATKMVAERLFLTANSYVGAGDSKFSVVRYGNVWSSRGGVIDLWNKQAPEGEIFITTPYATRFIITLDQTVKFIIECIDKMKGLEVFIPPKLPSVEMLDVAQVYAKIYNCKITTIPIRTGEKIHEKLEDGYTSGRARKLSLKEIEELIQMSSI